MGPEIDSSFVQFCRNSVLCLGLSITTILLIFALIAYFYFFVGAFIYEKITGMSVITGKRKKIPIKEAKERTPSVKNAEGQKISFAAGIKNRLGNWIMEKEKRKLEQEKIEREKRLEIIAREKQQ